MPKYAHRRSRTGRRSRAPAASSKPGKLTKRQVIALMPESDRNKLRSSKIDTTGMRKIIR